MLFYSAKTKARLAATIVFDLALLSLWVLAFKTYSGEAMDLAFLAGLAVTAVYAFLLRPHITHSGRRVTLVRREDVKYRVSEPVIDDEDVGELFDNRSSRIDHPHCMWGIYYDDTFKPKDDE